MSLRLYLFGMYSILVISLGLWLLLLFNVNPFKAPFWIIVLFYLMFFLFMMAVFAILGFYLKIWITNKEVIFAYLLPTLRQSAILSSILIGLLFLQQVRVLNWWVATLFVISIGLIELFFRSRR